MLYQRYLSCLPATNLRLLPVNVNTGWFHLRLHSFFHYQLHFDHIYLNYSKCCCALTVCGFAAKYLNDIWNAWAGFMPPKKSSAQLRFVPEFVLRFALEDKWANLAEGNFEFSSANIKIQKFNLYKYLTISISIYLPYIYSPSSTL